MDERLFEQVKALVEQWDYEWGCGPFDTCEPGEERLQKLNALTGRDWTAEGVREVCFEYHSHNSLEETVYFLFHGDYPPVTNVKLVFYRLKPGAALEPETVYEKYRLGGQMKALVHLSVEEITEALRKTPGFQEHPWNGYRPEELRMDALVQPDSWSDAHFWALWYGGRGNPQPDHLLCLSCHNLSGEQLQMLTERLAGLKIPLQYREEDHAY